MDFKDKCTDEKEYESVHNSTLDGLIKNIDQNIQVGSIGAIYADARYSHAYYMVKFTSSQYNL